MSPPSQLDCDSLPRYSDQVKPSSSTLPSPPPPAYSPTQGEDYASFLARQFAIWHNSGEQREERNRAHENRLEEHRTNDSGAYALLLVFVVLLIVAIVEATK